jgi:hypothetical protein
VLFLLRYVRDGETRVVIMDGWSLMHARLSASCLGLGTFVEGHPIDPATMAGVPLQAVGRPMSRQEAMALLNLTKKPPARSAIRRSH